MELGFIVQENQALMEKKSNSLSEINSKENSEAFERDFDLSEHEIADNLFETMVFELVAKPNAEFLRGELEAALKLGKEELADRRGKGEVVSLSEVVISYFEADFTKAEKEGELIILILKLAETMRTEKEKDEIEKKIDPVTEIKNRRAFDQHLDYLIGSRRKEDKKDFCLIILDLDDFKKVNDTYGHLEGDETLKRFAKKTKALIRESDEVYRTGGDEFGILLPDTNQESGEILLERVLKESNLSEIKVSGGLSFCEAGKECTRDEIYKKADDNMYKNKRDNKE